MRSHEWILSGSAWWPNLQNRKPMEAVADWLQVGASMVFVARYSIALSRMVWSLGEDWSDCQRIASGSWQTWHWTFPRNRKISENHGIRGQFMWLFLLLSLEPRNPRRERGARVIRYGPCSAKKVIDPLLTTATGVSKWSEHGRYIPLVEWWSM